MRRMLLGVQIKSETYKPGKIMNEYLEFLERKKQRIEESGFEIEDWMLNPALFDFQRHIVKTALRKGKYAIFADCGRPNVARPARA